MKLFTALKNNLGDIAKAIYRFPFTFAILVSIAVVNIIAVERETSYWKTIITLTVAALAFLTAQVTSERIGKNPVFKIIPFLGSSLITAVYYLFIGNSDELTSEIGINTACLVFALLISFIWIPSIKNEYDFNSSFLIFFKAIFTSAFFSAIIWGGISLIIAAVDTLLFDVNEKLYAHTAGIVWIVWAPILLLSLIPVLYGAVSGPEKINKARSYPKFFEVLLSYVLIPLSVVYTLVLILYIVKTIAEGNWNDNLLEPLSLSYCIAVLIIYVLVSALENKFTRLFRLIFPKLLLLISIFQITASVITVLSEGLINSRYFVLVVCLYSVICGIVFCFLPVKKNGIIAAFAVIIALLCISPYINSFSLSYMSQSSMLKSTLERNEMLKSGNVVPSDTISREDKNLVSSSVLYLYNNDMLKDVGILPEDFDLYSDYEKTFGFTLYESEGPSEESKYYAVDETVPLDINDLEYFTVVRADLVYDTSETTICTVTEDSGDYMIVMTNSNNQRYIELVCLGGCSLISVSLDDMLESIYENQPTSEKGTVSPDEMTFDYETVDARIKISFREVSSYKNKFDSSEYFYAFIMFSIN